MDLQQDELAPVRQPPPGPMTYEEFLEWADDETHAEWVDGQVILLPLNVTERHARILWFLQGLFFAAAQVGLPGTAYSEPFQMYLAAQRRGRSPDLFFVRTERLHLMDRLYLRGPADLIVEIVSPESRRRDRVIKLGEYEAAGVPEYWLIDAERLSLEIRVLGPDGRYQLVFSGDSGLYQSPTLAELRLRLEWLWQERPPSKDEMDSVLGQPSR